MNDNGINQEHGADPVDPVLEPFIESMRPQFEALDAEYKAKQVELDEIRERRGRLEKAMRTLATGVAPVRVKDTAPKSINDWKPSENLQRQVLKVLAEAGDEGLTVPEATRATGLSSTAVDKVFRFYRGDKLRLAGRRDKATLYKLMPAEREKFEQKAETNADQS